jgi:hypothetical protein
MGLRKDYTFGLDIAQYLELAGEDIQIWFSSMGAHSGRLMPPADARTGEWKFVERDTPSIITVVGNFFPSDAALDERKKTSALNISQNKDGTYALIGGTSVCFNICRRDDPLTAKNYEELDRFLKNCPSR